MSIKVDLAELSGEIEGRGPGFLVTSGPDGRPHTTQVWFSIEGQTLRAPSGRKSSRNIGAQPLVALLWPPANQGDYSLIIDGDAVVEDLGDEGGTAVITATHAILHRPAADGTGNDCKAV